MFHTHFRSGSVNPEREARLCGLDYTQPPDNPVERAAVSTADWINGVWQQLMNPDETTRKNMKDHGLWINALRKENIFTIAQDASKGKERGIGPEKFLLSLDSEHRQIELLRYTQGLIPAVVRNNPAYHDVFAVPGMDVVLDDKLNYAVDELHKTGKKVEINDRSRRITVDALRMIVGDEVSGTDDETKIARAIALDSLHVLYPQGGMSARAYYEYKHELKNLSDDKQPVPDVRLLRQPKYLSLIRSSTLKGALTMGVIAERDLELAAIKIEQADVEKEKAKDEARKQKAKINPEDRNKLEAEGKSIGENFANMWEKYPLIVMGLVGVALWKGKEMLSSNKRFLGILPNKWIMTLLIGTFGYLGFIKGDENPFETMGNAAKGVVDKTAAFAKEKYYKVRGIAKSQKEMLDRSELVARFLDKKTYKFMVEAMVGFGALEQVRLEAVAKSFDLSSDGRGGKLDLTKTGKQKSLLSTAIDGLAEKGKVNRSEAYKFLEENNEKVSDALAEFFLVLGGEQPGNGPIMEEIEAARKQKSEELGRTASYDDITDIEIRHKIVMLATKGKALCASGSYARKTFIDVIEDIVHRSEGKDRTIDNADRIDNIRSRRGKEFFVYENLRAASADPKSKEADQAKKLALEESLPEFLDQCVGQYRILDADAAEAVMDEVKKLTAKSLPEVLAEIEKIKYIILVAAKGADQLPLNQAQVREMLLKRNEITVGSTTEHIWDWANKQGSKLGITIDSGFRKDIHQIADLEHMLARSISKGVRTDATDKFKPLQEDLNAYAAQIKERRDPKRMAEILIGKLTETQLKSVGGALAAKNLMEALIKDQLDKVMNERETFLARNWGNQIVIAFLMKHRKDGKHEPETDKEALRITATEIENLRRDFAETFNLVMGKDPGSLLASLPMAQALERIHSAQNDIENAGRDSVIRLRMLAIAKELGVDYVMLQNANTTAAANIRKTVMNLANIIVRSFVTLAPGITDSDEYTLRDLITFIDGQRAAGVKAIDELSSLEQLRDILKIMGFEPGPPTPRLSASTSTPTPSPGSGSGTPLPSPGSGGGGPTPSPGSTPSGPMPSPGTPSSPMPGGTSGTGPTPSPGGTGGPPPGPNAGPMGPAPGPMGPTGPTPTPGGPSGPNPGPNTGPTAPAPGRGGPSGPTPTPGGPTGPTPTPGGPSGPNPGPNTGPTAPAPGRGGPSGPTPTPGGPNNPNPAPGTPGSPKPK